MAQSSTQNCLIRFETSHGGFTVELFPKEAPVTVENFLGYVDERFFDDTIVHRIVPGFVIQGGLPGGLSFCWRRNASVSNGVLRLSSP